MRSAFTQELILDMFTVMNCSIASIILVYCCTLARVALSDTTGRIKDLIELHELFDFPETTEHFAVLEIGLQREVSTYFWRELLDNVQNLVFVGTSETMPNATFNDTSIQIELGSPTNESFLDELCLRFGPFDLIVDSDTHQNSFTVAWTLRKLFPCMTDYSHYVIMNPLNVNETPLDGSVMSELVRLYTSVHHYHPHYGHDEVVDYFDPVYSDRVKSVQMLENLVVIERAPMIRIKEIGRGDIRIPWLQFGVAKYHLDNGRILNMAVDMGENSNLLDHAKINQQCRDVCAQTPELMRVSSSIEACAREVKRHLTHASYFSNDPFLFNDDV